MKDRIISVLHRTWDAIGYDVLELTGGEASRAEVIEMVCDANRIDMYGNDNEAVKAFYSLSRKEQDKICKEAFPYKKYC